MLPYVVTAAFHITGAAGFVQTFADAACQLFYGAVAIVEHMRRVCRFITLVDVVIADPVDRSMVYDHMIY